MRRADFEVIQITQDIVFIADLDTGGISVTNDAESVVQRVLAQFPARRIVYRDSMGGWDELAHDGRAFVCFRPYRKGDEPQIPSGFF